MLLVWLDLLLSVYDWKVILPLEVYMAARRLSFTNEEMRAALLLITLDRYWTAAQRVHCCSSALMSGGSRSVVCGGPGKSLTRTSGFDPTFLVREDINSGGPSCDCCLSIAVNSHTVQNGPGTCRAEFGAQFENQDISFATRHCVNTHTQQF